MSVRFFICSVTIVKVRTEYWGQVQPDGLAVLNEAAAPAIVSMNVIVDSWILKVLQT